VSITAMPAKLPGTLSMASHYVWVYNAQPPVCPTSCMSACTNWLHCTCSVRKSLAEMHIMRQNPTVAGAQPPSGSTKHLLSVVLNLLSNRKLEI
jgi:hypothetical protein